jgi:CHAT domain-containing protein/tetratricopeptide (TPR) repeat protein
MANDFPLLLFMPGNPKIGYSPVPDASMETMDKHALELFQLLDTKLDGGFEEEWIANSITVFPREGLSAMVQQALVFAPLMEELMQNESLSNPVERANKIIRALSLFEKEQNLGLWGMLHNELGLAQIAQSHSSADRKLLIKNSIRSFENALEVVNIENDPMGWSYITGNLASALGWYSDLVVDPVEKANLIETSIARMKVVTKAWEDGDLWVYEIDLNGGESIFDQEKRINVQQQTKTQAFSTLAEIYRRRMNGDVKTNFNLAMEAYQNSLVDYYDYLESQEDIQKRFNLPMSNRNHRFLMGWVVALANLGVFCLLKVDGDEMDNIEQSMEYLEESLELIDQSFFYKPTGTEIEPDVAMPTLRPMILKHLGIVYGKKAQKIDDPNFIKSMEYFDKSAEIWSYNSHPRLWTGVMMNKIAIAGDIDRDALNISEIVEIYNKCLGVIDKENSTDEWGKITVSLANIYLDYFENDRAKLGKSVSLMQEALNIYTSDAHPQERSTILQRLGDAQLSIYGREQGTSLARKFYLEAISEVKNKGFSDREQNAYAHLGKFEFELGNWENAYVAIKEAILINEYRLGSSFTDKGLKKITDQASDIYDIASFCSIMLGRFDSAIETMESGRTRLLRRTLFSTANPDEHVDKLVELRNEILDLEREYELPANTPARKSTREISELLLARSNKFAEEIKKSIAFVPIPLLDDMLKAIPVGTLFIAFVATSMGGFAILLPSNLSTVSSENVIVIPEMTIDNHYMLAIGNKEKPGWLYSYLAVNIYHKSISNDSWLDTINSQTDRIWLEMIDPIFPKIKRHMPASIVFVSSQLSQYLPLHAASTGKSDDRRYFMDFFESVTYTPSFHSYITSSRGKPAKSTVSNGLVVGVGKYLKNLPSIPSTILESIYISELLNSKALINEEALLEDVVDRFTKSNIAHFACHGDFQWFGDVNGAGLHLYDSALTYPDILRLNCKNLSLLVLSACQTGAISIDNVNESIGLVTAFMQSGAKAVISSLWLVDDLSTALLMMKFYEYLQVMDSNVALNKAQKWLRTAKRDDLLDMIDKIAELNSLELKSLMTSGWIQDLRISNSSYTPYENPFYWGAFTYNGPINV